MIALGAVAIVLAALCGTLYVREKDVPAPLPVSPIQHLDDRKRAIYENLRDLQFEYRLGKLSDGDYGQTKQALQRELALVLAEMEAATGKLAPANAASASAAVAATTPAPGTVCPHCGARFAQPLRFCGECGKPMA